MIPALTIRQPWASAFFQPTNPKDIENRTWRTGYTGRLLIHAGQGVDRFGLQVLGDRGFDHKHDRGAVLGTVELVGCHEAGSAECGGLRWDCPENPWAFWPSVDVPRIFHWRVERPRLFVTPIPASGRLQLWTPGPSVQHLAKIAEVEPW